MNWPKTWLRGRVCRKRSGCTQRSYLRYFAISCSMGCTLARTLRWVWTMPLGSEVVPEVKMIWNGRLFGDGFA